MKILPVLVIAFSLLSGSAAAKDDNWIAHRHTQDDGLTNNAVRAVLRDSRGYVWMGTSNGLNRFDGQNYVEIRIDGGVPDNNYITALMEDSRGRIWIGTAAGVCVYKPGQTNATRFSSMAEYDFQVYQIAKEDASHILIPSKDHGFFRIDTDHSDFRKIDSGNSNTLPFSPVALCLDAAGTCWFINSDGSLYHSSDHLISAETVIPSEISPFIGKRIHKMYYSPGFLLIGMTDAILIMNIRTREYRIHKSISNIHGLLSSSEDELWAACDIGIVVFDADMNILHTFKMTDLPGGGDGETMPNSALLDICSDGGNGYWIGSFGGAIHLLQNRTGLKAFRGYYTSRIVPAKDGSIWIGTENKGLLHYFPKENRIESVKLPISSTNIQGLCLDGDNLYVGAWAANNLVALNTKSGRLTSFPVSSNVTSLCKIGKDCILIGSTAGLKMLSNWKINDIEGMNISIRNLYADRHDCIWISTYHNGLYCIKRSSLTVTGHPDYEQYISNIESDECLQSNKVCCAFEDKQGNMWVATENAGFYKMDESRSSFKRIELDECRAAYGFSEDNRGYIWITTDKGLLCMNPSSGYYFLFKKGDELISDQYNYNSNVIDDSGNLYVGTSAGFVMFDTNRFPVTTKGGRLLLPLQEYIQSLSLRHRDNNIVIPVSSISNDVLDNSKIMWRCLQLGINSWQELKEEALVFNNLCSGQYELQLHLQSIPNKEVLDKRRLYITVEVPMLLRWWAWVIYVCLLGSIVLVSRVFIRRRTEKRILDETNKIEAEYAKNLYASKLDFITDLAHEIRTPLTLITAPAESIKSKLSKNADSSVLDEINMISRNTERLNELMLQLMDFRIIEQQGYEINPEKCNLSALIKNVFDRFNSSSSNKDIDYKLFLPEKPVWAISDANALDRIISNLLTNAFKYSASYIVLRLESVNNRFRIICENDGTVVPINMRERIFKLFVRYKDGKHSISGSGIGLYTGRSLAQLIGGTLKMDSDLSVNRFILEAPLTSDAFKENGKDSYTAPVLHSLTPESSNSSTGHVTSLLIVEDNDDMRSFLVGLMSGYFTIMQARDGYEAREILSGPDPIPDIVLSDVMMPRIDGFELCRIIKQDINICHIPVVLLTAKADTESKVEGLEYGADAYVEKPFAPEYLVAVVKGILENRKRLQAYYLSKPLVNSSSIPRSKLEDSLIQKIEQFMEERLDDETIRVEDIASAMSMSKSSLQRKMQALFGMSVNEYVTLYRLKVAARIMDSEDVPVSEIGFRVGFTSHSYFSKCFKKQFGITPREFKERNRS
jgi:signal transduction histidine kinase/DNA-binding response OmpR family regulator/streptogramin lyase